MNEESPLLPRVRILCLGNEFVHDDGIGVRVGRVLRRLDLPSRISVELRLVAGLELLDEFDAEQEILLVDACVTPGGAPGTCSVMEFEAATELAQTPYSGHGIGIAEVLRIAERVAPDNLPCRARVVAIEALTLDGYGTSLSPPVAAALPRAVETVLRALDADRELILLGRQEAERWINWEPEVNDVLEGG